MREDLASGSGPSGRGGSVHLWTLRRSFWLFQTLWWMRESEAHFLLCTPAIWNGRPSAGGDLDCGCKERAVPGLRLSSWGTDWATKGLQAPLLTLLSLGEVHAPLQAASLAESLVPGSYWPIEEFGGCVGSGAVENPLALPARASHVQAFRGTAISAVAP